MCPSKPGENSHHHYHDPVYIGGGCGGPGHPTTMGDYHRPISGAWEVSCPFGKQSQDSASWMTRDRRPNASLSGCRIRAGQPADASEVRTLQGRKGRLIYATAYSFCSFDSLQALPPASAMSDLAALATRQATKFPDAHRLAPRTRSSILGHPGCLECRAGARLPRPGRPRRNRNNGGLDRDHLLSPVRTRYRCHLSEPRLGVKDGAQRKYMLPYSPNLLSGLERLSALMASCIFYRVFRHIHLLRCCQ